MTDVVGVLQIHPGHTGAVGSDIACRLIGDEYVDVPDVRIQRIMRERFSVEFESVKVVVELAAAGLFQAVTEQLGSVVCPG